MSPNAMNLAQLDLNLLVALDALLREQHVTRAGQSVGLSQPAMSAALSRLRILFEDELLLRIGSRTSTARRWPRSWCSTCSGSAW